MAGNLNARATGLVSFLELITDGRAPDNLAGVVQGTVELGSFYRIAKRERLADISPNVSAPTGQAVMTFNALQPPNNEYWIVDHFDVTWFTQTTRVAGYCAMFPTVGTNPTALAVGQASNNGGNGTTVSLADRQFFLLPGWVLQGRTTENPGAATINGSASILVTRVRF